VSACVRIDPGSEAQTARYISEVSDTKATRNNSTSPSQQDRQCRPSPQPKPRISSRRRYVVLPTYELTPGDQRPRNRRRQLRVPRPVGRRAQRQLWWCGWWGLRRWWGGVVETRGAAAAVVEGCWRRVAVGASSLPASTRLDSARLCPYREKNKRCMSSAVRHPRVCTSATIVGHCSSIVRPTRLARLIIVLTSVALDAWTRVGTTPPHGHVWTMAVTTPTALMPVPHAPRRPMPYHRSSGGHARASGRSIIDRATRASDPLAQTTRNAIRSVEWGERVCAATTTAAATASARAHTPRAPQNSHVLPARHVRIMAGTRRVRRRLEHQPAGGANETCGGEADADIGARHLPAARRARNNRQARC
jgi:hypothetical protein